MILYITNNNLNLEILAKCNHALNVKHYFNICINEQILITIIWYANV